MVNSKVIGGIIIAVSIIGIIYAISTSDGAPKTPYTESDTVVAIGDSATLEKNTIDSDNNQNFTIDEDGVKRYTVSAVDTPDLGD